MIERFRYGPEYLDWYYNKGGWRVTLYGTDSVFGRTDMTDLFKKAVGPWDSPTSPYAEYVDPVYSAVVQAWVARHSEIYKLIPKTTYLREGDSMKFFETDLTPMVDLAAGGTPFTTGTHESAPTIVSLDNILPCYTSDPWITDLTARTRSTWQNDPKLNPEFIRNYHMELLPHNLDVKLGLTVDTEGTEETRMESIDRIISSENESGNATHVSDAGDGDLYFCNASKVVDRSGDTDETYGGGAGDGISLPTTAAARVLSLDYIDDVMAASKKYSKNKRYICLTGTKTLNEWTKLVDPKQRFLDSPMDVQITMNGVSTRPGTNAGFSVASYITNGIKVPVFTSDYVANESSGNRSATITDADIGNIYFIDLDAIELRVAIPVTYLETPPAAMLSMDSITTRHMLLFAAQLLATNYRAHAAVKYLKST